MYRTHIPRVRIYDQFGEVTDLSDEERDDLVRRDVAARIAMEQYKMQMVKDKKGRRIYTYIFLVLYMLLVASTAYTVWSDYHP